MATKWNCALCSKQILWTELFTFYSKGAVHFSCFREDAMKGKAAGIPAAAMLDLLENELKMIVTYKKSIGETTNEDVKKLLDENEKDAERHAAMLTKQIERFALG